MKLHPPESDKTEPELLLIWELKSLQAEEKPLVIFIRAAVKGGGGAWHRGEAVLNTGSIPI